MINNTIISGGGKPTNILGIQNEVANATITATLGAKILTATTDDSGYAFFTNLETGTWTLQATKTGRYVGPKTITITASQSVYFIKYPFRTYVYDGSLNSGGSDGANVCASFSGGWNGAGGGGTNSYNDTNLTRVTTAQYLQYLYNASPIDLTPFTTLYVKCKPAYDNGRVGISPSTSVGSATWRTYQTIGSTSTTTVSVDGSSFNNGTGYVVLGRNYGSIVLYSAWFE